MIFFWCISIVITVVAMGILLFPLYRYNTALLPISHRKKWPLSLAIVVIFTCLGPILYLKLGAYDKVSSYLITIQQTKILNAEIKKLGSLQHIISLLRQKVSAKPDANGLFLLGRLYLKTQQFSLAVQAFAQANQLNPNQPDILLGYIHSLYFNHSEKLTDKAKVLLAELLRLQPNQPEAIALLAIDAYQQGDYSKAIENWEKLLPYVEKGSSAQQNLLEMIGAAQQKMLKSSMLAKQSKKNTHPLTQLKVHVQLSKAVKNQVKADETVFIYAQSTTGSTIPLAVVRRQVRDLPTTVILDNQNAMLATTKLENVKQVKITARISQSGQATPTANDLKGVSTVINSQNPPALISITIQ